MTHMPVTRDLQPMMKRKDRRATIIDAVWQRIVTLATNPDLLAVVLFCVIGLGLTINLVVRHPDLGAIIQRSDLYP